MTTEEINDFVEHQLSVWPEAASNFDALSRVGRKPLHIGTKGSEPVRVSESQK